MRLRRNPIPWKQTAPKAIAVELMRAAAVAFGKPEIRFAATGPVSSNG